MEENTTSTQEQTVSQAQQQAQQVAKENNPPTIIIQNTHRYSWFYISFNSYFFSMGSFLRMDRLDFRTYSIRNRRYQNT